MKGHRIKWKNLVFPPTPLKYNRHFASSRSARDQLELYQNYTTIINSWKNKFSILQEYTPNYVKTIRHIQNLSALNKDCFITQDRTFTSWDLNGSYDFILLPETEAHFEIVCRFSSFSFLVTFKITFTELHNELHLLSASAKHRLKAVCFILFNFLKPARQLNGCIVYSSPYN